jgi:hypothetical protein
MSAFTTYNRIGVDHHRQTVETLCVMVSILGHGIADSHGDDHGGLSTMINMTQEQLVGIGSDKLPSFPWNSGVYFVSGLFQVAPDSQILHFGLVLSELVGACLME